MNLQKILEYCNQLNASDVLLSHGAKPYFRINGELNTYDEFEILDAKTLRELIQSVLSVEQIHQLEKKHVLDFVLENDNFNYRINLVEQENGIFAAIRYLPKKLLSLDELKVPTIIKTLAEQTNGLILITAPEGNGKTTTLSAMIEYINANRAVHIITLENTIEFHFTSKKSLIDQRQILKKTSVADMLAIALRGNPDVLMVSDVSDRDTLRLALNAAETGQLVIATMHATSAPIAIRRMIDLFPGSEKETIRNLLATVLQGIISQRLVEKIGGGRIAAYEILISNYATTNLIHQDQIDQLYSTMEMNHELGMCTLKNSLEQLLQQKIISQETFWREAEGKIDKRVHSNNPMITA